VAQNQRNVWRRKRNHQQQYQRQRKDAAWRVSAYGVNDEENNVSNKIEIMVSAGDANKRSASGGISVWLAKCSRIRRIVSVNINENHGVTALLTMYCTRV